MTVVREDQWRIVDDNSRKQDEVKQNAIHSNSIKRDDGIIKQGSSYDNILSTVTNILSVTKTTEKPTNSILQAITPLSSYTLKYFFFHLGGRD